VDAGPTLGNTTDRSQADASVARILDSIESADALVVGTAVYKGAYTGMFKHLFDLFAMDALARKPVLLTATGAAPGHASVIDYHLRPLFLFFDARVGTRGLYGLTPDFEAPDRLAADFLPRIERSVDELAEMLQVAGHRRAA
jgi:FMN reductase